VSDAADTKPAYAWGAAAHDLPSIRGAALPQDLGRMTGPQLYDAYCATCHQAQGEGSFDGGLPSLFHNAALGRANTNNLVMVILQGLHRHPDVNMPGFAKELSDPQVAALGNYLTQRWGNPQAKVTVEQVRTLRSGGAGSPLLMLARIGLIAVGVLVLAVLVAWVKKRRRRSVM
jgi:mono/diheme cytochrome c family protein